MPAYRETALNIGVRRTALMSIKKRESLFISPLERDKVLLLSLTSVLRLMYIDTPPTIVLKGGTAIYCL